MINKTMFRLLFGLFLFALGIALTIRANIGLAPWDVFHQGLGQVMGWTIGRTSILVGIVIVLFNTLMGEQPGWGTLGNMLLIGLFLDGILMWLPIPTMANWFLGTLMAILGMVCIAVASYFYLSTGLGAGPRDGLMVVLTKRTGWPVGLIRNGIEGSVLLVGIFFGGHFGFGTLLMALLIGPIVQGVFKLLRFDVSALEHKVFSKKKRRPIDTSGTKP